VNILEYQQGQNKKTEEQDQKSVSSVSVPGAGVEPASTNSAIRAFLSVDFQKYFKSTFCQIVLYVGWRNWPSLQPGPSLNCSTGAILYGRSCHPGVFICRLSKIL